MRTIDGQIELSITIYDSDGPVSDDEAVKQARVYARQRGIHTHKLSEPELDRASDNEVCVVFYQSL